MQNQEQKFEASQEAQEYIQKLQQGRIELPPDSNELERQAFAQLKELGQQMRQMSTAQADIEKEIAAAQNKQKAITRDIDITSGQMAAYAQLLVAAEASRRKPEPTSNPKVPAKEPDKKTGGGNGKVQAAEGDSKTADKKPKLKAVKAKADKPEAHA